MVVALRRMDTCRREDIPAGDAADVEIVDYHWFGTSVEFWLNLQKLYELRLAHASIGKKVKTLPTLGMTNQPPLS